MLIYCHTPIILEEKDKQSGRTVSHQIDRIITSLCHNTNLQSTFEQRKHINRAIETTHTKENIGWAYYASTISGGFNRERLDTSQYTMNLLN